MDVSLHIENYRFPESRTQAEGFIHTHLAASLVMGPAQILGALDLLTHEVYGSDYPAFFSLSINKVATGQTVTIHDRGMPPRPLAVAKIESLRSPSPPGFNHIHTEYLARRGNRTTLSEARLPENRAVDHGGITVVTANENNVVDIVRCAWQTYGYSYEYGELYNTDRLREFVLSGTMLSALAFHEKTGEAVAHVSLVRSDDGSASAEVDNLLVIPSFRGPKARSTLEQLADWIDEAAIKLDLHTLFYHGMCCHPRSQRFATRCGFIETGVLLCAVPIHTCFRGLVDTLTQRDSLMLAVKPLLPPQPFGPHLPDRHRNFLLEVERDYLNVAPKEGPMAPVPNRRKTAPRTSAELQTRIWPTGAATIQAVELSAGAIRHLQEMVDRLRHNQAEPIYIYLSTEDSATPDACEALSEKGFCLAGVQPGTALGAALILQRTGSTQFDFDQIQTVSPHSKKILNYIAADWERTAPMRQR